MIFLVKAIGSNDDLFIFLDKRKIGDVVILDINADGTGYSALPFTSINGILLEASNISFAETGGGKYRLSYEVQEGDSDVIPGSRELEATVILEKPSGNTGDPYSHIDNPSQITIDAHPPEITSMEVPSIPPKACCYVPTVAG